MKYAIAVAVTLGLALIAWILDLPRELGAHPWWSQKVVMSGALIGLAGGLAANWVLNGRRITAFLLLIGTLIGFAIAKYGQTEFAASYAEDALAGQLWYFGWHLTCILSFATVAAASLIRHRNPAQ